MRPPPLRTLAATALGVLAALALAELVVRQIYTYALVYEPGYGYVNAPGGLVRWGREGHGTSRWAAHGVREKDAPPPGGRALLVFGDSQTEALMVDDGEAFTARLERAFEREGRPTRVVNAGRSTTSLADAIGYEERFRRLFAPCWTVLQISAEDLGPDAWGAGKPHFAQAEGGPLTVEIVPQRAHAGLSGKLWWLRQRSMLVGYAAARAAELGRGLSDEPPLFRAGHEKPKAPVKRSYPVEDELDLAAKAYGGRVTFLYLSPFDPREPTRLEPETEARVFSHCAARGLRCVSARASYPRFAAEGKAPYGFSNSAYNEGHLNRDGHAAIAEALTEHFRGFDPCGVL
ncbi:MAG TPA: hypothetical protein VFS43_22415 [Polyangiaceae bacterium]|nr:hypothetical protein [Polyangiaceae bacterium]